MISKIEDSRRFQPESHESPNEMDHLPQQPKDLFECKVFLGIWVFGCAEASQDGKERTAAMGEMQNSQVGLSLIAMARGGI